MKNITYFKTVLLQATLITATLFYSSSCNNSQKTEDSKNIVEEYNEAKFDNTNKEKDAQFLVNATEINLAEIQLGKLAQQNSRRVDVKELGKMMEKAHSKCLDHLIELANKKLITIPILLTDNAQDAYKKLKDKSGADFDKEYCDMMVNGHKDAIAAFEKASKELRDEDIRQWAIGTLPELHKHLEHAIACQEECEKMK